MMLSFGQPLNGICQIAYLVPDIQAAMRNYSEALNIGPWLFLEHWRAEDERYLGQPSAFDISVALGFSGSILVELIEQHNDAPSMFKEARVSGSYGFHHFAISTQAFEADRERYRQRGYDVIFEAAMPGWLGGGRVNYLDSRSELGGMIELVEMTPEFEQCTLELKRPSENWDRSALTFTLAPPGS